MIRNWYRVNTETKGNNKKEEDGSFKGQGIMDLELVKVPSGFSS